MSITLTGGDVSTATQVIVYPPEYSLPPSTTRVTWTNLGPLTTAFTAQPSCSTASSAPLFVYDRSNTESGIIFRGACQWYNYGSVLPWLDCQPSGTIYQSIYSNTEAYYNSYFSPGIRCPAGYSSANVFVLDSSDVSTASISGDTMRTTGTHVFCCPSGFTSTLSSCWSRITTAISTSLCGDDTCDSTGNRTLTLQSTTDTWETCSYTPSPFSWAPSQQVVTVQQVLPPVYMIHQSSDIVTSESLPTKDKIVIGVVVPIVVIFAALAGVYFFKKKSKARNERKSNAQRPIDLKVIEREKLLEGPKASSRQWHWV